MNIYILRNKVNRESNTYDSCVVIASTEEEARNTHPDGTFHELVGEPCEGNKWLKTWWRPHEWCYPIDVEVELIGICSKECTRRVVCKSFNAW